MVEHLPYVRSQVPSLDTGRKEEKEEEMEGKRRAGKTERKDTGYTEASTERKPWHGGSIE